MYYRYIYINVCINIFNIYTTIYEYEVVKQTNRDLTRLTQQESFAN